MTIFVRAPPEVYFQMAVKTLFLIEKDGESFYEPQISSLFRFYWEMDQLYY